MPGKYRPNVAGLFTSTDGRILVCERIDHRDSWQFPQGGVDEGEPLDAAFAREMEEELGLRPEHYQVLKHGDGYRYEFPQQHRRFKKYVGQEQTYFLCQLTAPDSVIPQLAAAEEEVAVKSH